MTSTYNTVSHYEFGDKLGAGGIGEVFRDGEGQPQNVGASSS